MVPIGQAARVSYKAVSDLAGKAAVFAILLVAARVLPTAAFGLFSLASTFGWILSVGTDFGLQIHMAREIARAPHELSAILRPILRLRLWLGLTAIGVTIPVAFVLLPRGDATAFVLIVSAYVASALVEFLNYVYRAVARSEMESTLNLLQRIASLAAALVLLHFTPDLRALALALVVPPVLVFAWSARYVSGLGQDAGPADATIAARPLSIGIFARDVLPIGLGIVLSAVYFRVDLFLVQFWRGVDEVARYNAVFRLVEALRLFPAAVLTVLLPEVFRRRDAAFVFRLSAGLTAFGGLVAAALYVTAPLVLDLTYGAKYASAVPTLRVLALAFPLLSLNYGLTHQVIGWGGQRAYAVVCGAALVVNVGMNALLIPPLGSTGAAWATLGTEAVLTIAWVLALMASRRSHGPDPER